MADIAELGTQLQAAAKAGDLNEIKRLTEEIHAAQAAPSFAEAWNYENKPAEPVPGGFESAWGFTKGGARA